MTEHPLFYIVLLGLIVIVFAQIAYKKEKPSTQQSKAIEEFEQTVELFASDLEEQNEALAKLFHETRRDYEVHVAKQTGKIEFLEKHAQEMACEMAQLKQALGESAAAAAVEVGQALASAPHEQAAGGTDKLSTEKLRGGVPSKPDATNAAAGVEAATVRENASAAVDQPSSGDSAQPHDVEVQAEALPTLKERYQELFAMHNGGKSIEYIAKKLGKNKGEVSLILMLAQKEEAAG